MIFAAMLVLGIILGFVGAGGSGLTITMLTVGFGIPIHTALGVALAAMSFTMLSGMISHYREGDVLIREGLATGLGGMVGGFTGSQVANLLPAELLVNFTGGLMIFSTVILYFTLFRRKLIDRFIAKYASVATGSRFYFRAGCLGLITGFLSGAFGIGSTAFIQIGLMLFFGASIYHAVGTTMMVILPISIAGGFGYLTSGHLDFGIFIQTLIGLAGGAYFGAKLTRLAPKNLLRVIVMCMPSIGGLLLILK